MNQADSGIINTLLTQCGMIACPKDEVSDVVIMNTCSVREHAESRVLFLCGFDHRFGTVLISFVI